MLLVQPFGHVLAGVSWLLGLFLSDRLRRRRCARFTRLPKIVLSLAGTLIGGSVKAQEAPIYFDTLAGWSGGRGTADGQGPDARFHHPNAVAVDQLGNIYVADLYNYTIRKITPAGEVSTLAGKAGVSGAVDGFREQARFHQPTAVAVDLVGNIFVADGAGHVVRKVSPTGQVVTIAGKSGEPGALDGLGSAARFSYPAGVAVDASGNVYVGDYWNFAVRRISPEGLVTTWAGRLGTEGMVDGAGNDARFYHASALTFDRAGNLYVVDEGVGWSDMSDVRKITPAGVVTTLTSGQRRILRGIAVDAQGTVYVSDAGSATIRRLTPAGEAEPFAGGGWPPPEGKDGQGAVANFKRPTGMAINLAGNLLVADRDHHTIREVTPSAFVTTLAGAVEYSQRGFRDGIGSTARFDSPSDVELDAAGNVFVADRGNHVIRKITPSGVVTTFAGIPGRSGSRDGPSNQAEFSSPSALTFDPRGNLYVADRGNHVIRRIAPDGNVTTLAGLAGIRGAANGFGPTARFDTIASIVADTRGYIFITDLNHAVRQITPEGEVSTFAGKLGVRGNVSFITDGPRLEATFTSLSGIATDGAGNFYVGDNHTIRKIDANGTVSTIAGRLGMPGFRDGQGEEALFHREIGLRLGIDGNLWIVDSENYMVRKMSPSGVVTTVGGNSSFSGSLDGYGPAAWFRRPTGIAVSPSGIIYVADASGDKIRRGVPRSTSRLMAISTRSRAGQGDQTLIMGFVVEGNKQVLVRGVGPGIASGVPTALTDPRLELYRFQGGGFTNVDENNDWANTNAMMQTFARLGASALAANSKDAALLNNIEGGVYTAHVTSGGASGVALVEAYDGDKGEGGSRFAALSTRTVAGSGDDTLIVGMVLDGSGPKTVVVRALGPTLGARDGVSGVLSDPKLQLFRMAHGTSSLIGENDDWGGLHELKATFTAVGAGALSGDTSKDAAMLVTLDPGVYTVHVSGAAGTTGVALVEIFDVP